MNDDWMNPRSVWAFTHTPKKNGTYYVIQRKKAHIVTGPSGMMYAWAQWASFSTKEDRDKELARLREKNQDWHLRGRTLVYVNDSEISGDPFEYMDR